MPNIKKSEYDDLKSKALLYDRLYQQHLLDIQAATNQTAMISLLNMRLDIEKLNNEQLMKAFRNQMEEAEKWKRHYDAACETFKIEEEIQIPGCFSPMDTIKYIVKKQKEVNDAIDNYAREMS